MIDAAAKVRNLIALAVNPAAAPGEAANAALAAARLIHKGDLLSTEKAPQPTATPKEQPPQSAVKFRKIQTRYHSWCCICRDEILPGDLVWWAKGQPIRCAARHTPKDGYRHE